MHCTIIAKAPVAGLVKTRLCPPCSAEQAARVAAAALADTFDVVASVARAAGVRTVLLLDGMPQPWMPTNFEIVHQRGDGLAERLCNGFADLGAGVIVGMETPSVAGALADGIDAVRRGLDVIGLATDGGYWMIGLSEAGVQLGTAAFDGVPMSQSNTGLSQLGRLHSLGRAVRTLPVARDLDTFDDLVAVAASGGVGQLVTVAREVIESL